MMALYISMKSNTIIWKYHCRCRISTYSSVVASKIKSYSHIRQIDKNTFLICSFIHSWVHSFTWQAKTTGIFLTYTTLSSSPSSSPLVCSCFFHQPGCLFAWSFSTPQTDTITHAPSGLATSTHDSSLLLERKNLKNPLITFTVGPLRLLTIWLLEVGH